MPDNFHELWKYQQYFANKAALAFQQKPIVEFSNTDRILETKEYILSLMTELKEVLDNIEWKRHRIIKKDYNRRNLLTELIDVQKYLWGLMAIWQVTEKEFEDTFIEKSAIVEQRWVQELEGRLDQLRKHNKIVLVDIDGVLNTYPQCFIDWAKNKKGVVINVEDREINPILWNSLKTEYRISGAKRFLPVKAGAKEALNFLHEAGYFIVIATNRPVSKFSNLFFDTLHWLRVNDLYHDYIHWADIESKIIEFSGILNGIKLVLDDDLSICKQFSSQGISTILITPESNLLEEVQK
ncbi:MAG: hypothetical protein AABY07_02550 [Nanoarchaeota archaeon]